MHEVVVPPAALEGDIAGDRLDRVLVEKPGVAGLEGRIHDVALADQAGAGDEIRRHPRKAGAQADMAPGATEAGAPERGVGHDAVPVVVGERRAPGQGVDLPKHHAAIDSRHPIGGRAIMLFGPEDADSGAGPQVVGRSQDAVHRVVAERRADLVVDRGEHADLIVADLASQLGGEDRLHQATGIDQAGRCVELLDPVEEERAPFRVANRLPGIEGELGHVAFYLGEVRVGRCPKGQVRREAIAQVAAELRLAAAVVKWCTSARRGTRQVRRHRRNNVEHMSGVQVGQPLEFARLRQERGGGKLHHGPGLFLAGALHLAEEVDPPRLCLAGLEADALERDPDLDLVPLRRDVPLGIPDKILREVGLLTRRRATSCHAAGQATTFVQGTVPLDAKGVGGEEHRLSPVVEGRQEHLDVVVAEDPVARGQGGVHRTGSVERANTDVQRRC